MGYNEEALKRIFAKSSEAAKNADEADKTPEPVTETDSVQEAVIRPMPIPDAKQIIDLPIVKLDDYPKQLFKPYTAEKLNKLEMSIRENGVIEPLVVRNVSGSYQIVCGHNRKRAAAQAGFEFVPCFLKDLSDDEADVIMVETNLQTRTGLLPSEKGFAYKLKLKQ